MGIDIVTSKGEMVMGYCVGAKPPTVGCVGNGMSAYGFFLVK